MSGNTRFDTVVNISNSVFGKTSDNIIIVNSEDYVEVYLAVKCSEYEGTDKNKMFINKKIPSSYYLRYSNAIYVKCI